MPHLIVEYAEDIAKDTDIQDLVVEVFNGAEESGLFGAKDIKVRATGMSNYWTAGSKQPFVCVEVKLLPGRSAEQKKDLSQRVFDKVVAKVSDNVAVSVEVNDLDRDAYTKRG